MYCPYFLVQHQRQQKANKPIILASVKRSFKGKTFPSLLALLVHQRQDGRLLSIQSQHTGRGERVNLLTVTTDTADYSEFLLMHLSSLCPLVTCNFRKCLISSSVPFVRIHFLCGLSCSSTVPFPTALSEWHRRLVWLWLWKLWLQWPTLCCHGYCTWSVHLHSFG